MTHAVTDWLLDADPALRWQVLRDLLDAPEMAWSAERVRVETEGWGARLLAPLTQLGRRSLDCYVLIAVVALAAPAIAGYRPDQGAGQLVAAAALVGCLAWTAARDAARDRAVGRPVTAAAPASR